MANKINFNDVKGKGCTLTYNSSFTKNFNKNMEKCQKYIDNLVVTNLMDYVSYKSGTQAKSIRMATVVGSGLVVINVPYAEYQAYSKRIRKRAGLRGTYPFERMKSDKSKSMLGQLQAYARRLSE